jgi:thiol-disulfide isomerase/thioredoxin
MNVKRAVVCAALAVGLVACGGGVDGLAPVATIDPRPATFVEAKVEYESAAAVAGPVTFMDFYAEWCTVCKQTTPLVQRLRDEFEGQVIFVSYDVDAPASRDIVRQYRVSGVPTFVILNDRQEVISRFVGGFGYAEMKGRLERYIGKP